MREWFIYLVRCGDGTLYTGITTDVQRRIEEHRRGGRRSARYVRSRTVSSLVFSRPVGDRSTAARAEYAVKALGRREKEALAAGTLTLEDVLDARRSRSERDRSNDAILR